MKSVKQQLQELLATNPMTAEVLVKIHALCADPVATQKQSLSDQIAIRNLKAAVNSLRDQLNPAQPVQEPVNKEALLEDLFQLQLKRQQEIIQAGTAVTFGTSEKTFPCLQADPETLMFPAGTPVAIGTHINRNGGLVGIVTGTTQQAGRLKCSLWCPRQTATPFKKSATVTGYNLQNDGLPSPCELLGAALTSARAYSIGALVKCSGVYLEVTGSRQEGGLTIHQVKEFEAPQPPAPIVNRSTPAQEPMQPGHSMYWSRTLA